MNSTITVALHFMWVRYNIHEPDSGLGPVKCGGAQWHTHEYCHV